MGSLKKRAVIFTFDGTLVDNLRVHAETFADAFGQRGYRAEVDALIKLFGESGVRISRHIVGPAIAGDLVREIDNLKDALLRRRHLEKAEATAGAQRLLDALVAADLKCLAVSEGRHAYVEPCLDRIGLRAPFSIVLCGDDVSSASGIGDIFVAAAHRAGLQPKQVAVVSCVPFYLAAAKKAGFTPIGVGSPQFKPAALGADGTKSVYKDLHALARGLDESPIMAK